MSVKEFKPQFMQVGVLTAALQELTPREVLAAQGIPVQGVGREPYRS